MYFHKKMPLQPNFQLIIHLLTFIDALTFLMPVLNSYLFTTLLENNVNFPEQGLYLLLTNW